MKENSYQKHYHDPGDHLDMKWKESINTGFISVKEAAELSGFSRQYIYGIMAEGKMPSLSFGKYKKIPWKGFVYWYSHLDVTPDSPIGSASLSLKAVIAYTGFERCWVFRFVQRYSIESYYVGMLRRFNKKQIEKAWDIERSKLDLWIDSKNVLNTYPITSKELFTAVAQHKVKVNTHSDIILYNRKDIEIILKGGICRYE